MALVTQYFPLTLVSVVSCFVSALFHDRKPLSADTTIAPSSGIDESRQDQLSDPSSGASEKGAMVVDSMSANPDESHHDMQDNDSELSEGETYVYVSHATYDIRILKYASTTSRML
jgi:hypothetical protein